METKKLKLEGEVQDTIAKQQLFGWKVVSKEKVREMVGINEYENFTKLVLERDDQASQYADYVRLEKEYAAAEEDIKNAGIAKEEWEKQKPKNKPVWKKTKSYTTSRGYTTEWDEYYGNWQPLPWIVYVGCFSPFLPILLIIIIINQSKKKKLQKKLAAEVAAWDKSYQEWEERAKKLQYEYAVANNTLEVVISDLNNLKD